MPITTNNLLQRLPKLTHPILFWDGQAQVATLAHSPRKWLRLMTLVELKDWLATLKHSPHLPETDTAQWHSFQSGWAGYFSYEAGHALLTGENRTPHLPLAEFGWYEGSEQITLTQLPRFNAEQSVLSWHSAWPYSRYQQAFNQVQNYLRAGDCYQVNLALPFSCNENLTERSPLALLQSFNPTFGGYLKTAERTLFSVSPERFMSVSGARIETRPIKGTVARSQDPKQDAANQAWLKNSAKNQAENLMIVDLLRNDLSRYAKPHSVKVEKLFALESHANVHHLVSTISAQKQPHISMAEVISSALPGGSITGAPKKRAVEIIAELEAAPRHAYCGAMGYFDERGLADFNILIRTLEAQSSGAQCWAGGGVVLDSQCQEEWQELHTKVQRILQEF
jgi:para-aminobenzoate synthetase component 1